MNFPCPHCESEESLTDRDASEINPVVSKEFQANFEEPSLPRSSRIPDLKPSHNSSKAHVPSSIRPAVQEQIKEPEKDMESIIISMANDMKTLAPDIKTIMKSMKIIERILTNMNK